MTLIEMELIESAGSVMINMEKISEVIEESEGARLIMDSGFSYVVTPDTFVAAMNTLGEDAKYLKLQRGGVDSPSEEVVE